MTQKPKALLILDIVTALAFAASFYMSLVFAPMERVMGNVQRVFYHHVAAGWAGMIGFGLALVAAIIYLVRGDRKWDMISLAGVEVGLVFSFINIVTGSIWARPIWNTWWTWDPRLVTATVMELVYIAYLMLRAGIEDPDRRTIHPVVILSNTPSGDGAFDMTADMRTAFFFALATFTLVGIDMLWHRIRLGQMSDKVEQLKLDAMS
jgi:heme exporter protein C